MNKQIKNIIGYCSPYLFGDEVNTLVNYITNLEKENELLKEELTNLKNDITRVYNTMVSLETINKEEMEEIEEI